MKWRADECFDNDIIRGLLRREPGFDLVRAEDVPEVAGRDDETLLAWAGKNQRVVLTHDLAPMALTLQLPGQPASAAIVGSERITSGMPVVQAQSAPNGTRKLNPN